MNAGPTLEELIAGFFPSLEAEAVDFIAPPADALGLVKRLRRLFATFRGRALAEKAATELAYFLRSWRVAGKKKAILLAEPLYFLDFLRNALPGHDVIRLRTDGYPMGPRWKGRLLRSVDGVHWEETHKDDFHIEAVAYLELK